MSDILTDLYPSQVKFTPIRDLSVWGFLRDLDSSNKPDYTLRHLECSVKDYNTFYDQMRIYILNHGVGKIPCVNGSNACCNNSKVLVRDNFEFSLEYMKNSYLMSNQFSEENPNYFFNKFVKNLSIWKKYNLTYSDSKHDTDKSSIEMILFCKFVSDLGCVVKATYTLDKN